MDEVLRANRMRRARWSDPRGVEAERAHIKSRTRQSAVEEAGRRGGGGSNVLGRAVEGGGRKRTRWRGCDLNALGEREGKAAVIVVDGEGKRLGLSQRRGVLNCFARLPSTRLALFRARSESDAASR